MSNSSIIIDFLSIMSLMCIYMCVRARARVCVCVFTYYI